MLNEIIHFVHKLRKVKYLVRYSNNPLVTQKDTVASHSWRAATLALLLRKDLEKRDINAQKVVDLLLIHDLVEINNEEVTALGNRDRKAKAFIEEETAKILLSEYSGSWVEGTQQLLDEFIAQQTIEAKIAKALDNYESNMHVIEEKEPLRDDNHRQLTIDYIKRREGILDTIDELIGVQLDEIRRVEK